MYKIPKLPSPAERKCEFVVLPRGAQCLLAWPGRADQEPDGRCVGVSRESRTFCAHRVALGRPSLPLRKAVNCRFPLSVGCTPGRSTHWALSGVAFRTRQRSRLPTCTQHRLTHTVTPSGRPGSIPTRRAICWWTLGHGFAYGEDVGGFIGTDSFAFSADDVTEEAKGFAIAQWFFQWAFAGARGWRELLRDETDRRRLCSSCGQVMARNEPRCTRAGPRCEGFGMTRLVCRCRCCLPAG